MRLFVLVGLLAATSWAQAAPEQVHLGISEDPSAALSVLWLDSERDEGAEVRLRGPDGERVVAARLVDGPSAGFAFEATLDGLAPGAAYEYEVGGRTFSFSTPPRVGAFSFVVLGDMGVSPQAAATVEVVEELAPSLILHAGDLSYGEGRPLEWAAWFNMVEPVAARIPWVTALGNHETYSGSSLAGLAGLPSPAEIAFYKQRFGLPGDELAYSFDWAGVHFVALDTFSERSIPAGAARWLEEDLAAHANASWTVVFLHEPPYSSNDRHGSSRRVQDAFQHVFEAGGVDVVFSAHDHAFERSYPIRGGSHSWSEGRDFVEGEGVVYVVTGGAGARLYEEWAPAPSWSARRAALHHVVLVNASEESLELRVVPTSSESFEDSFRIVKGEPPEGRVLGAVEDARVPAVGAWGGALACGVAALATRLARRK